MHKKVGMSDLFYLHSFIYDGSLCVNTEVDRGEGRDRYSLVL